MFKSTSNFMKSMKTQTNKKIRKDKMINILSSNELSRLSILTLSICLVIYISLPCKSQLLIHKLIRHPIVLVMLVIICLLISYVNVIISLALLLFLSVLYLYNNKDYNTSCYINDNARNGNDITEGFKGDYMEDFKKKEKDMEKSIKSIFNEKGPFRKQLENSKKYHKELFEEEIARNNILTLEAKKNKKRNKSKEKFNNDNIKNKEDFASVPMRKFNPGDKEDTNLLLVMELCDDIKNRIKYEYEEGTYLKKYIKDKLEEIIDLLELVEED